MHIEQGSGPALFLPRQFAEKKPRRKTGPSLMGGNAPIGRICCYLSRRVAQRAKSQPRIDCAISVAGSPHRLGISFLFETWNQAGAGALSRRWTALHPLSFPSVHMICPGRPRPGLFLWAEAWMGSGVRDGPRLHVA